MKECKHKRVKRNFPFGRKSAPKRYCKDCGEPIAKGSNKQTTPKKKQSIAKEKYPDISSLV